jgi:hypothetical protein
LIGKKSIICAVGHWEIFLTTVREAEKVGCERSLEGERKQNHSEATKTTKLRTAACMNESRQRHEFLAQKMRKGGIDEEITCLQMLHKRLPVLYGDFGDLMHNRVSISTHRVISVIILAPRPRVNFGSI